MSRKLVNISVGVHPREREKLDQCAELVGVSRSQMVRGALLEFFRQRQQPDDDGEEEKVSR